MLTEQIMDYDFGFQKSKMFSEYQQFVQRKFGNIKPLDENNISLCPNYNKPTKKSSQETDLKYNLKKQLLRKFLLDNNFSYLPNSEEERNFNPFDPLNTLDDIENRLDEIERTNYEEYYRRLYEWQGYEWHPYSHLEKDYISYMDYLEKKHNEMTNYQANQQEIIQKIKDKKSIEIGKNLFNKLTEKIYLENKDTQDNKNKSKQEIIENFLDENISYERVDENPDDDSWETVPIKINNRSHKKKKY